MKKLLILLFATFILLPMYAKDITVNVVFENPENIKDFTGELYIKELDKSYPINGTEDFEIKLPEKEKFTISLKDKTNSAIISYPTKVTEKNNKIIIRFIKPIDISKNMSGLEEEKDGLNFITFGIIDETNSDKYLNFKKEFNVGFILKSDTIDPSSYKEAVENNKRLADLLSQKFGENWKEKLPIKILGIE